MITSIDSNCNDKSIELHKREIIPDFIVPKGLVVGKCTIDIREKKKHRLPSI